MKGEQLRRARRTEFHESVVGLGKILAPLLVMLAEEIHRRLCPGALYLPAEQEGDGKGRGSENIEWPFHRGIVAGDCGPVI